MPSHYRGRHRPYDGRHRPAPANRSMPRIAGTGALLPTAAAATLVLTATGAHLGSAPSIDLAGNNALAASAQSQSQSLLTDSQENQDVKLNALQAQARLVQDRAARDSERRTLDAVAAENAKRAAEEAARASDSGTQQIGETQSTADAHAWVPPINGSYSLSSGFGMRWGAMHPAQDFAIPVGTPVKALSSGTVIFAGVSGGYGNKVELQLWDGTVVWYAHNSKLLVRQGDTVSPGEVVSLSGNTGHSTGPHLHLEIHPGGGTPVNPLGWLRSHGDMP